MLVKRWYCPTGKVTFSLLPDCLASRLPGTLDEVEQVVATVETRQAQGASLEKVSAELRPDLMDPRNAVRWVRRRVHAVKVVLLALAWISTEGECPKREVFWAGLAASDRRAG
jgi:hypothetical protein